MKQKNSDRKHPYSYYSRLLTYFVLISVSCVLILGILLSGFFFFKLNHTTSQYNEALLKNAQIEVQKTVEYANNTVRQLGVNRLVTKYLNPTGKTDYVEINDISRTITDTVAANDFLDSVCVVYPSRNLSVTSYGVFSADSFLDRKWLEAADKADGRLVWLGKRSVQKDMLATTSDQVVTLVGKLPLFRSYTDGYLIINLKESFISGKLTSSQYGGGHLLIASPEGRLISSSLKLTDQEYQERYQSIIKNAEVDISGRIIKANSKLSVLNVSVSEVNQWRYIAYTPINTFVRDFLISTGMILSFVVVVIGISFLIAHRFSKKAYRPIQNLIQSVSNPELTGAEVSDEYPEFRQINLNLQNLLKEKDELQTQIQKMLPSLKEKFFLELLSGQVLDESSLQEYMAFLRIDVASCQRFLAVTLWIDEYRDICAKMSNEERVLYALAIKHFVETYAESLGVFCCSAELDLHTISFVFGLPTAKGMREVITQIGEAALDYVRQSFHFTITIGIGHSVRDIISLQVSANQALEALEQSFIYGNNQLIFFRSIEKDSFGGYINPLSYEKALTNAIKTTNREEINRILSDILTLICKNLYDIRLIRQFYLSILNMIFIMEHELSGDPEQSSYRLNQLVSQIYQMDTLQGIHRIADEVCKGITDKIEQQRSVKARQTVEEILKYLEDNYARDISLDDVSAKVSYTPTYINKILKASVQKTFYDLLTDLRLEKAKQLLGETELQIYQIAEQVGYLNVQSFIRMFKKLEGITPGKFRESARD